ncbi:DUF3617 family protein [uncultured Brevundimonas sp.]|uniref:DUF3617 domain-containing protein n=1 Tax=uncultured Brevundimonas sp. TaxID=213418 RepID=UPI0030EF9630|tara:strand:+ start:127 stop:762 length:636 start_codon:yes stop_codon:yes gene_type:complete
MTRTALLLTLTATAALTACNREPQPAAPDPAAVAPAAVPAEPGAAATPATATPARATAPRLRPGLWRVTMSGDGATGTSRMCVDRAIQSRMSVIGASQSAGACQESTTRALPGGGFAVHSVCDATAMGGGRTVTDGAVTGDLTTGYVNHMTSATTGAPVAHMNRTMSMTATGTWAGACPADMKPGDMEMPGGMRFNMAEMAEGAAHMTTRP